MEITPIIAIQKYILVLAKNNVCNFSNGIYITAQIGQKYIVKEIKILC